MQNAPLWVLFKFAQVLVVVPLPFSAEKYLVKLADYFENVY